MYRKSGGVIWRIARKQEKLRGRLILQVNVSAKNPASTLNLYDCSACM